MESSTAAASSQSTGSATIADMPALAAERYGDRPAAMSKRDGGWQEVSFAELGTIVSEIARGLVDLGLQPGERVSLLCTTRPEWTYADFAITSAGGVVVPIYPTNSPSECAWVAGNSESRFVVCEDASQVAKIAEVRGELPALEAVVAIDAGGDVGDAIPLEELRERGRARDPEEVAARARAVRPEDPYTIIYTSGTTGPPKGCVLSHGK
jgi:long-chain acyl-CoA synthetase